MQKLCTQENTVPPGEPWQTTNKLSLH